MDIERKVRLRMDRNIQRLIRFRACEKPKSNRVKCLDSKSVISVNVSVFKPVWVSSFSKMGEFLP